MFEASLRHDSGSLDLDFCLVFDQRADLDERHRRKVLAHDTAIGLAEFAQAQQIFLLVENEPGQPRDVFGAATGLDNKRHDIRKRLSRLRDKIFALEPLLGIPADLPGEKDRAAFGDDAIAKTFGELPATRMKKCMRSRHLLSPHEAPEGGPCRSRKRWILPVWVFGSASMNFTERGYLNGAIVALT